MIACLLLAVASPSAVGGPKQAGFEAEGEVLAPGYTFVTFQEWNSFTCPEIPTTQGVSSYFIAVPKRFWGKQLLVEATGGGPLSDDFPLQMNFWSGDCVALEASVSSPGVSPGDTRFIEVFQNADVSYTFRLTGRPFKQQF